MAAGLILLAVVIRNEWETFMVVIGLIVIGAGLGALVSVLFNALAAASPKELAGDVGSLRGTTNNLAGAVGTAIAGALSDWRLERYHHDAAGRQPNDSRQSSRRRSISTMSPLSATTD